MPHFRVDDALHSHPKAQRAGDEAMGMWARAGSFCMAYLTNGFVPEWWVKQQPKGTTKARKLVEVGLWHDGAQLDGEKGYQFHEFVGPGRQDSREKIEADRELARKRKQKSRGSSQQESQQESQRDDPRDERRSSRRSPSRDARVTQPNPTQSTSLVTLEREGNLSNARDERPPDRCSRHMNDPLPPPCGRCAAARQAANDWDELRENAIRERRRRVLREIADCPDCDERGLVEIGSNTQAPCPKRHLETADA